MPRRPSKKPPRYIRVEEHAQLEGCCIGTVDMIPKLLVERFGKPSPGDGNKVSGEFIFADEHGAEFYIYDWKLTGDYNPACSPERLWDFDDIVQLQVGGSPRRRGSLRRFLTWLDSALADGLQSDQDWLAALPAGPCPPESQERLLQLLEHGGSKTQLAALEAIRRIGEPIAAPQLLIQLLQLLDLGQPVRPATLEAMSVFTELSHSSWVQSSIMEQLNSEFVSTRRNGLSALSALGPRVWTDVVLARFAELLTEEPTAKAALSVMSGILAGLGRTTPPPTPEIVLRVALQLSSPDGAIRRSAAHAVPALGKAAAVPEVLTPLFRMLGEADVQTRVPAEMGFKKLGQLAAIPGFLSHLCQSVQPEDFLVQASALRVVRNIAKATGESDAGRRLQEIIRCSRSR